MRIAYTNLIDSSTITASTAITNYPFTNVQNQRLASTYRTSTLSAIEIVVALPSYVSEITTFAIMGHNLTSAAIISVSLNTLENITYNDDMILKFFQFEAGTIITEAGDSLLIEDGNNIITEASTLPSYAYIHISDASNPDGYIEIGRLWLGSYITIDPSSLEDFRVIKKRSDIVTHGKNRNKYGSIGTGWRRFELSFPQTQEATISLINTMYDSVGNHSSFIFCNFDVIRDYVLVEPCYVSIDGEVTFNHKTRMKFEYALNMEEEL